jgi:beta-lactamase superfamily II metal-dependent hydrolase
MVFAIEMLPARHGDALLVEYGEPPAVHRILVDAGPRDAFAHVTRRLQKITKLDLLVVTHVDADHIDGSVRLLNRTELSMEVDELWFNDGPLLKEATRGILGPVEGEFLAALADVHGLPRNASFGGQALYVSDKGPLPAATLPGGLRVTVLSPELPNLVALARRWRAVLADAGLTTGDTISALEELQERAGLSGMLGGDSVSALAARAFIEDRAVANGSSLALLIEYRNKRLLLSGDAFPSVLARSLRRFQGGAPVKVHAATLPHHGSAANTSEELLDALHCDTFLVSTSGARFEHPDPESIARVVRRATPARPMHLVFNYRTKYNERWAHRGLQQRHAFDARFRDDAELSIRVDLT